MLKKAVATIAVAAMLYTSGVAFSHTMPVRHYRYCCAPKSNKFLKHSHHIKIRPPILGVLNSTFLSRFTKLGEFRLTAYTGDDPEQGTGRYTSLGEVARYGLVAVPSWIPLGTYLYIPGYGLAKASDHGSAVHDMHIDLCFGLGAPGSNAYHMAQQWGTKYRVSVYRIPPGLISLFK